MQAPTEDKVSAIKCTDEGLNAACLFYLDLVHAARAGQNLSGPGLVRNDGE